MIGCFGCQIRVSCCPECSQFGCMCICQGIPMSSILMVWPVGFCVGYIQIICIAEQRSSSCSLLLFLCPTPYVPMTLWSILSSDPTLAQKSPITVSLSFLCTLLTLFCRSVQKLLMNPLLLLVLVCIPVLQLLDVLLSEIWLIKIVHGIQRTYMVISSLPVTASSMARISIISSVLTPNSALSKLVFKCLSELKP